MNRPTYFLTEEGKTKLETELAELTGPRRDSIAKRLKSAIEMGDLSENADYKAAKEEQSFLEGRIQEIEAILNYSQVVSTDQIKPGVIQIGSKVAVKESGYPPEVYEIVGMKESNPKERKITYESPIGKALIGHKVGDNVKVELPNKVVIEFEVLDVN